MVGRDEHVGQRRGRHREGQPRSQGPREVPGRLPARPKHEGEESRADPREQGKHGDRAGQGDAADAHDDAGHRSGRGVRQARQVDLRQRPRDEGDRGLQSEPRHVELTERGHGIRGDQHRYRARAHRVDDDVGHAHEGHLPVARRHLVQGRVRGLALAGVAGAPRQVGDGEPLARDRRPNGRPQPTIREEAAHQLQGRDTEGAHDRRARNRLESPVAGQPVGTHLPLGQEQDGDADGEQPARERGPVARAHPRPGGGRDQGGQGGGDQHAA